MKLSRLIKPKAGSVSALFLHIQKTAGTSLIALSRKYYGDSLISHGDYCSHLPNDLVKINFVSGHFGYAYGRHLMKERYSFTFLRNPIERVLSLYYFCRSRNPNEYAIFGLAHKHSLAGFLEACLADPFFKMQIWNNQVWQLAYGYTQLDTLTLDDFSPDRLLKLAKEHLGKFSHVGFTETFSTDTAIICKALGFPKLGAVNQLPMENVTPGRLSLSEHTTETKKMLMSLTELDQELYDYARSLVAISSKPKFRGVWQW